MFYVKQNFGYAEVTTEITDENVFTRCPECGAEVQVDLEELLGDGEGDLFGTAICCSDCSTRCKAFSAVPDEVRCGLTGAELDDALRNMGLSPDEERAVREVCEKGYVIAPELRQRTERNLESGGGCYEHN